MLLAPRVNLRPHQGWQTAKVNVAARALSASITRAGIWRKVLEFVRLPLHSLESGAGAFLTIIFGQIFAYFQARPIASKIYDHSKRMKEKRVAPKVQAVGRGLGHSHNRPDTARIRRMARNGFRSRHGAQPMKPLRARSRSFDLG
jgi:hypothetical protein